MMKSRRILLVITALVSAAGCSGGGSSGIECGDSSHCDLSPGGACRVAGSGSAWCVYPDPSCDSGERWAEDDVGDGLAGQCVAAGPADAGVDAPIDAIDDAGPQVRAVTPSESQTDVGTTSVITVEFNEPVDPATITSASFSVQGMMPVQGALEVNGNTVTLFPSSRLDPETAYEATLSVSITDLAGNPLSAPFQWSFTTKAGGWGSATLVENDQNHQAANLGVAVGGGIAAAVWTMTPCNGTQCTTDRYPWVAIYRDGTWSGAQAIATTGIRASAPAIAVDQSGNATAVWLERRGSYTSVAAARYANETWSAAVLIESEEKGHAQTPAVAVDGQGNVAAVWTQNDGETDNVWVNIHSPAGGWATATKLESSSEDAGEAAIAGKPGSSAGFLALWKQGTSVVAREWSGGSWKSPASINKEDTSSLGSAPTVRFGSDGNAVAIWAQGDLWANRFTGTWGTAEVIDAFSSGLPDGRDLAAGPDGSMIATWLQYNGDTVVDVWQAQFNPASGWQSAFRIEANGGFATEPTVAIGASGMAIATWAQESGDTKSIWANRFSPANGWNAPELVETDSTGSARMPRVFYDAENNVFGAIWLQSIVGYASVYAAVYE